MAWERIESMRAWIVEDPGPIADGPLRFVELPEPEPGPNEVRVAVSTCGVCRTDLHLAEGDLTPHKPATVVGHEVVGRVDAIGPDAGRFTIGDRVGIPWLRHTCGVCRYCKRGAENLCVSPLFTGWDANGGYADYAVIDEAYAYRIPDVFDDEHAAPLLCAGIIGYRALERAALPENGVLGIYGFGGSAHLTIQVAIHQGARVHVMSRGAEARELALSLGASSAQGAMDRPPEPLDSAIDFTPVGETVNPALEALGPGGTVSIAGIHLTDIPPIIYETQLFYEKQLRSVTANTRADGERFLEIAAEIPIEVTTTPRPLEDAQNALVDLNAGRIDGAAVLHT